MPEIEIINTTSIPRIPTIKIPNNTSLPNTTHITRQLPPVFDMPCTTIRTDGTRNNQLFKDDPSGNTYICPLPFYEPLQYNKKDLVIIEPKKPPTNTERPELDTEEPSIPETNNEEKIECPDPKKNNPRIIDIDIIDFDFPNEKTNYHHTHQDIVQNCSPKGLGEVGTLMLNHIYNIK